MTDSTPPSIPPRTRPTSAAPTGRQATSSPVRTGTTDAWNGSDEAPVPVPTMSAGSNGSTASVLPPTVAPQPRTPTSAGRSTAAPGPTPAAGSAGSTGSGRSTSTGATTTSVRLGDGVTAPPEKQPDRATSPADDPEDDVPSPMMVAVGATTAWFKKAGVATGAAFTTLTRPRSEEPTMTANPTTAPAPAAPRQAPLGEHPRPSSGRIPTVSSHGGPRRVRLAISRVDPWSVMKLSLLLSVAIGIMFVVAVIVLWLTLDRMHVFAQVDDLVTQITGQESTIHVLQYVEFRRVVSGSMLIAVVDVFLLTALATIGAFLYNIVAALVGGVHVTMTDD